MPAKVAHLVLILRYLLSLRKFKQEPIMHAGGLQTNYQEIPETRKFCSLLVSKEDNT